MIKPYILPTKRATCLRIYYELKANSDLVEKQVKQTLQIASALTGWGFIANFATGLLGGITKTLVRVWPNERFDSEDEKQRIWNTFLEYNRRNATQYKTWHTQDLNSLNSHMAAIQRDIESIKASNDKAKRRYLPARLHMASGLARIIAQKSQGFGGAASLNEGKNLVGLGLAGLALYASTKG